MSDTKSKLPDMKELASMTGKLFNDIKTSVGQIIQNYKDVRAQPAADADISTKAPETPKTTSETSNEEKIK